MELGHGYSPTRCWSLRRWTTRAVHSPMGTRSADVLLSRSRHSAALCFTLSMVSLIEASAIHNFSHHNPVHTQYTILIILTEWNICLSATITGKFPEPYKKKFNNRYHKDKKPLSQLSTNIYLRNEATECIITAKRRNNDLFSKIHILNGMNINTLT